MFLGLSPLHCAAQQENLQIVLSILNTSNIDLCLVSQADIEFENTPLHYASMSLYSLLFKDGVCCLFYNSSHRIRRNILDCIDCL
jgi:hypothetical protein